MRNAVSLVRRLTLNTGASIPILGLGTWQSDPQVISPVIRHAIEKGYRHFDCAAMYNNEAEIGQSLNECIRDGLCTREELFITSKIQPQDMFPDKIEGAVNKTLEELKLDYLDLYLIHWPHRIKHSQKDGASQIEPYDPEWMKEVWSMLENIVTLEAIGVSNFSIKKIEKLLEGSIVEPAVNQVENHIYFQQPIMKRYLDSKNIIMQAYSPLGSPQRKSATVNDPIVLSDPVVKRIADAHHSSSAQICLAFQMADDRVVLPKSTNPTRLKENIDSVSIQLTEQDILDLRAVDRNYRLFRARFLSPFSTYPNFWDEDYETSYANTS